MRLFETHPECKNVFFLFRDVEDLERLRNNKELQTHGLRSVTPFTSSLNLSLSPFSLLPFYLLLSPSHPLIITHLSAPRQALSTSRDASAETVRTYVGTEFIRAVQPILKDNWTPEVEEAWKTLFLYISSIMKQGYLEEEKNQRNAMANTSRERPEKRLNVI
ncbi:unnamed protein product [Coregonus sp. 'balchen']|nr:unnamed protein product [Coregonus sp. 'balchen']